jgi:hypothetical protein
MDPARSLSDLLADLAAKIAFHRREEKLCADQEALFQKRRSAHAAELERAIRCHEALQAAAVAAQEMTAEPVPAAVPAQDLGTKARPKLTRMINLVLADLPWAAEIGSRQLTIEVNRRFAANLRKPVDPEQVALTLKRMAKTGRLHRLRKGRPYHGALYSRQAPG